MLVNSSQLSTEPEWLLAAIRLALRGQLDSLTLSELVVLGRESASASRWLQPHQAHLRDALLRLQYPDGSWGRDSGDWVTATTSWALLALETSHPVETGRAVAWLASVQTCDGAFLQSDISQVCNAYATAYAAAAMFEHGDLERASHAVGWLASRQRPDGGFDEPYVADSLMDPSVPSYIVHALSLVRGIPCGAIVEGCISFIVKHQNPSGSWILWNGDQESFEGTCAALRALGGHREEHAGSFRRGIAFVKNCINGKRLATWESITHAYVSMEECR